MVTAYLNTRGRERHRDYQFVGPAPPRPWWRDYADHTTFERPTVLVQTDGRGWQAYLSGIPSRRRDAVGTVIRYTVVAEGDPDEGASTALGTGDVLALIANWLADQDRPRADGAVSEALDAAFPEREVERLISAESEADHADVARRLAAALHALRLPVLTDPEPVPDAWLADLGRSPARAAFLQRVDALLAGQPGRALVLNLVGAAADLTGLLADPGSLAVLAPDLTDPAAIVRLDGEPGKKATLPTGTNAPESAPRPKPTPAAMRNLRGCLRLILIPIALIVTVLLALLGTLFYLR